MVEFIGALKIPCQFVFCGLGGYGQLKWNQFISVEMWEILLYALKQQIIFIDFLSEPWLISLATDIVGYVTYISHFITICYNSAHLNENKCAGHAKSMGFGELWSETVEINIYIIYLFITHLPRLIIGPHLFTPMI